MNKIEFLKKLDKELNLLDLEERKQILDFYEERFYSSTVYENKTELEVISELETPETIAKNVLEEYGISQKYTKTKEERHTGIKVSRLVFLILFDVFIASWLIPVLFSIVFAIGASLVSYIGVVGLIFGTHTTMDVYLFIFLTGGYILIFLIGLFVFDVSLYVLRAIINYHLNVFKYKKRDKVRKQLRKISVDEWFKKRKMFSFVRNISFLLAFVLMGYGAYGLYASEEDFFEVYANNPDNIQVYNEVLTEDITNNDLWEINIAVDNLDIEIVSIDGDEVIITHSYDEYYEFELTIDIEENVITVNSNDSKFSFFDIKEILKFFGDRDKVKIEIPEDLLIGDLYISTNSGKITLTDIEVDKVDAYTSNGGITAEYIISNNYMNLSSSNGIIVVRNSIGLLQKLTIVTSNGSIVIRESEYRDYELKTTNGSINLENLNVTNQDGFTLIAHTSNGSIDADEAYIKNVDLDTTNGDIDFHNDDFTFVLDVFETDTTNGHISQNVD